MFHEFKIVNRSAKGDQEEDRGDKAAEDQADNGRGFVLICDQADQAQEQA
jgi:hypothetical protein